MRADDEAGGAAGVDLYWLPLGAGGHFVRLNGRAYEALRARIERRPADDLYHSALQVQVPEATFVVEQAPVRDLSGEQRGVVATGAVGSRWAGRFRIFRYEIRLWRNGQIPDIGEAVDSPRQLTSDDHRVRRVARLARDASPRTWSLARKPRKRRANFGCARYGWGCACLLATWSREGEHSRSCAPGAFHGCTRPIRHRRAVARSRHDGDEPCTGDRRAAACRRPRGGRNAGHPTRATCERGDRGARVVAWLHEVLHGS